MASQKNVIVGLSGGVDSSVAAYLLKCAGHHVTAIFMKNWQEDEGFCPAEADYQDAQMAAKHLGIELRLVNFADEYWQNVFADFLSELKAGRTPNPDVLCNKEIKFKAFLNYAKQQGADYIATGHYARTDHQHLIKGKDPKKDQSYFLYLLNQKQLQQSLFPLGDMTKEAVRTLATEIGLHNHIKKDSTGICFIGERRFRTFLEDYLPAQTGAIETEQGEVIGEHSGVFFYTIGQRQGLQIGGLRGKSEAPWYVAKKDVSRNVLTVVQGEHPLLYQKKITITKLHFINEPPALNTPLKAKTRYRQEDQHCMLISLEKDKAEVWFQSPQRAITPGQSLVFYKDDICLGGGIIESS